MAQTAKTRVATEVKITNTVTIPVDLIRDILIERFKVPVDAIRGAELDIPDFYGDEVTLKWTTTERREEIE